MLWPISRPNATHCQVIDPAELPLVALRLPANLPGRMSDRFFAADARPTKREDFRLRSSIPINEKIDVEIDVFVFKFLAKQKQFVDFYRFLVKKDRH